MLSWRRIRSPRGDRHHCYQRGGLRADSLLPSAALHVVSLSSLIYFLVVRCSPLVAVSKSFLASPEISWGSEVQYHHREAERAEENRSDDHRMKQSPNPRDNDLDGRKCYGETVRSQSLRMDTIPCVFSFTSWSR